MLYFIKDCWVEIIVYAIGIGLLLGFGYLVSAYQCHEKWKHSGMIPHFSMPAGCQLEKADGTWIPEASYREVL